MNCKNVFHSVMPVTDPASPVDINGWRSCTRCGMTTFLDSLLCSVTPLASFRQIHESIPSSLNTKRLISNNYRVQCTIFIIQQVSASHDSGRWPGQEGRVLQLGTGLILSSFTTVNIAWVCFTEHAVSYPHGSILSRKLETMIIRDKTQSCKLS